MATPVEEAIEYLHFAMQADLEHGVAWMNDEASVAFVKNYPTINKAIGNLFKFLPEH